MSEPHAEHQPAGGRSAAQNKRLWCLVRALEAAYGAGNGELRMRAIVRAVAGHDCTRRLTAAQMARVLDRLAREAGEPPRPARTRAPRVPRPLELPTPQQMALMAHLYQHLGWGPPRRQGFTRRVCGAPWPQTRAAANRIIEALKAMQARGYAERTTKEGAP